MLLAYFQSHPEFFLTGVFILGLIFGSFFNVVIYRLPIMLMKQWRTDCQNFLEEKYHGEISINTPSEPGEPFNLVKPDSTCPHCGHKIKAWENIPVISYFFLKGKCSGCKAHISIRYPLIELLTAFLALICAWKFGATPMALGAIILTWGLICLALIDFDTQYLPDQITLPLLWLGLIFNINHIFTDLESAIIGVIIGYLALWSVYQAFKLITGKEGMGYGDFKLLAMLGAWLGWQYIPVIVIVSSLVGSIFGISLILLKKHQRSIPIPFGPYLAIAGWIAVLWGHEINSTYLRWLSS